VHDSDENMGAGETEEPFDEPWDEHVEPESVTTGYEHEPETAHTAAHERGGVWSSDMTKRATSFRANNICGNAMLASREDIRGSQVAWAQMWYDEWQASILDPAETLEGFWTAQDILRKAKREVTRKQYEIEIWVGPMHAWRDGQEEVYAEVYKCSRLLARVYTCTSDQSAQPRHFQASHDESVV